MAIVDHQVHWYPREFLESLVGRSEYPIVNRLSDGRYQLLIDDEADQVRVEGLVLAVEEHLASAAANDIDAIVVGPATLSEVLHLDAGEATELLNRLHEHYAVAQRTYPGRFVGLASLPMQSTKHALEVLDRAIGELDLRGIALLTTNEGRPVIDDGLWPVYERIAELGVPIFLHPGYRSMTRRSLGTFRDVALGWMFQTSVAALQLIDSGILDAQPDLVVVHPHLGGVLPYVAGRVGPVPGSAREPLRHYFARNFYVDTAAATPPAIAVACETYGVERIVFASDHPFAAMDVRRRFLEDSTTPAVARQIYASRVSGLRLT